MTSHQPPAITGIYETHLPVRDLARSLDFYCGKLGLELAREYPDGRLAFVWVGGRGTGMLGLWAGSTGPLSMSLHFAFAMEKSDVLTSASLLKSKGIQPLGFNGEPLEQPVVLGWMPALSQYFKDPDGHSLEFIALLDDAPDLDFGVQPYGAWQARSTQG